jgi:hypothetical protein
MSRPGVVATSKGGEAQAGIKPLPVPPKKDFNTKKELLEELKEEIDKKFDEIRKKTSFINDTEFEQKEMLSKEVYPRLNRLRSMLDGKAKSVADLNIPETRELVIKFLSEKFGDKISAAAKSYISDRVVPRFQEIKNQIEKLETDDENGIKTVFEEGDKLFDNEHAVVRALIFPDLNDAIGKVYPDKKLQGSELAQWIVAKLITSES